MSRIEEKITLEQQKAIERAEKAQAKKQSQQAANWRKWVKAEQPRIAAFRREIEKLFPCLDGDFVVGPRKNAHEQFVAVVAVCSRDLEIRKASPTAGHFTLFTPYETSSGYGWEKHWSDEKLESDSKLKELIKKFINRCAYEAQRARDYYDSLPIGNTD